MNVAILYESKQSPNDLQTVKILLVRSEFKFREKMYLPFRRNALVHECVPSLNGLLIVYSLFVEIL